MSLRLLTPEDSTWVAPLIKPFFKGPITEGRISKMIIGSNPGVTLGDPDVVTPVGQGIVAKLEHYRLDVSFPVPFLRGKLATQIVLLGPLTLGTPQTEQFLTDKMLPLLANILFEASQRFPQIATRPVWAALDERVINIVSQVFPNARTLITGNSFGYIWHTRHEDATNAVANLR